MAVTQTWKVQAAPGYLLEDIYLKSADAHAFLVSFKPTSLPSPLKLHRKQRKDLQDRLPGLNPSLYTQVKEVLDENKAQRHIRGGMATRRKYKGE